MSDEAKRRLIERQAEIMAEQIVKRNEENPPPAPTAQEVREALDFYEEEVLPLMPKPN